MSSSKIRKKEDQYLLDALDFVAQNKKLDLYENKIINSNLKPKFYQSSEHQDRKLSFDFVCELERFFKRHFSFRCRTSWYVTTNDIGIRSKTDWGDDKCEMMKIMNGLGQYYIYYIENKQQDCIIMKYLIDINAIRTLYKEGRFSIKKMKDSKGEITMFKIADIRSLGGIIDEYDASAGLL